MSWRSLSCIFIHTKGKESFIDFLFFTVMIKHCSYVLRIITYLNQACMQYPAYQYNNYQLNWKDNDNKYYYLVMICITSICMVPSFIPFTRHACMEGIHNIAYCIDLVYFTLTVYLTYELYLHGETLELCFFFTMSKTYQKKKRFKFIVWCDSFLYAVMVIRSKH